MAAFALERSDGYEKGIEKRVLKPECLFFFVGLDYQDQFYDTWYKKSECPTFYFM